MRTGLLLLTASLLGCLAAPTADESFAGQWSGGADCGAGASWDLRWSGVLDDEGALDASGDLRAILDGEAGVQAWFVIYDLFVDFDGAGEQVLAVEAEVEACEGESSEGELTCQPLALGGPFLVDTTFEWDGEDSVDLEANDEPIGEPTWSCSGRMTRED